MPVGGVTESAAPADTRTRLLAAAILVPFFVLAVILGGPWFLACVAGLTAVGGWEFFELARRKRYRPRATAGIGLAVAFPIVLYGGAHEPLVLGAILAAGVVGIGIVQALDEEGVEALASVSVTVFGAVYTGLLFGHLVLVRELAREVPGAPYALGAALLAVPVALAWINDTAAYFVGRRWGHRRLLPRLSPGKSVEGAVGALVATVALAFPVLLVVNLYAPLFRPLDALALGLLTGIVAPCGDLLESAFKRDAGVKDSSALIPGHGGILDRFDSLLVVAPTFYWYVRGIVL